MTGGTGKVAPGELMRAEIAEQPARWLDLLGRSRATIDEAARLIRSVAPELVIFAARGSSDHAAMYGQYLTHNLLQIPAMLATPSSVTAFGATLRYPSSVMLAVSQSGESPDLLETVRSAKRAGVPVIALTNNETSTLAGLASVHIDLAAGAELSVAATKTYTAELLALYLVVSLAAGGDLEPVTRQVTATALAASSVIADTASVVGSLADSLTDVERMLVVGRGYSMSTAKEGALKLMETNAIAASGWSAADATHGPLGQVLPGTPVIVLTASPAGRESVHTFAAAAADMGARVITVGPTSGSASTVVEPDAVEHISLTSRHGEELADALIPLIEILPLQQLALELALRRGKDPDQPVGLAKVTKTM